MRTNMLLTGLGIAAIAGGVGWIYAPAGVIAAGLGLGAVGLLRDDGKPKK